jgi:hypothetical protein
VAVILGTLGDELGSDLDSGVRIVAPPIRCCQRLGSAEAVSAGVRKEVAQRATFLACRIVECNDALFDGDHRRPARQHLADRGQPK